MLTIQNKKRPIEYYHSEASIQILTIQKPSVVQIIRTALVGR